MWKCKKKKDVHNYHDEETKLHTSLLRNDESASKAFKSYLFFRTRRKKTLSPPDSRDNINGRLHPHRTALIQ